MGINANFFMSFLNIYNRIRDNFTHRCPGVYEFCKHRQHVIRFMIAGGLAGAVDLTLLFIFHGPLRINVVAATTLAFILSFLVSFTLQKFWTFKHQRGRKTGGQLFLYTLNTIIGLYLNGALMHWLVNREHVWYLLAQVLVGLTLATGNFLVYKFIVFKHHEHEIEVG